MENNLPKPKSYFSKKDRKALEETALELRELVKSSEQTFEKQVSYIAGGGLALSFVFVEKLVGNINGSVHPWILFVGLLGLAGCLIVNLWSQIVASKAHSANLEEIRYSLRLKPEDSPNENFYNFERCKARREEIILWNKATILFLCGGVVCIVVYLSWNLW